MRPARLWVTRAALAPLRWVGRRSITGARRATGWLAGPLRLLMRRRTRIVRRNLELCFPDLDVADRRRIERAHFRQLAEGLGETAYAWQHDGTLDESIGAVEGLEHLEAARSDGDGVLLLTGHFTCLELSARLFGQRVPSCGIYRPLRNPVLEQFQSQGRARYAEAMFKRDDMRSMVRHLRSGGVLWYAPDQDFGPHRSLFAPFFGIPTATARGIVELARLGRARVVPMVPFKDEQNGTVTVQLEPELTPFPSGNPAADLARVNAFLERAIRRAPAQYWWLHRRFKTAPDGEPDRYS